MPSRPQTSKDVFEIDVFEAWVLLDNYQRCSDAKYDLNYSPDEIVKHMEESKIKLPRDMLESLLYANNIVDEEGAWSHPEGIKFDTFVNHLLTNEFRFSKIYNYIYEAKQSDTKTKS